jgi:hypothetical protein
MTRSWLWNFRGGQLLLFDKRVREIKNEVSIRHIFSRTLYFCHMSRSISVSSLVRQDTLFLSLIDFFDHMLMCSFLRRWILTRLLLCGFVDINRHYATQSRGRSRSRCRDPWVGCSLRPKLIALDFRKRTMEKIVNLGGNHICFRKSLSQTFNLVRLDFSSMSPKFPFFFVIPTEPSIRTHRWCAEGSAEAPGSKVLPQWTLNLRVYAHTCTQTKEI